MKNKYPVILVCTCIIALIVWWILNPVQRTPVRLSNVSVQTVTPTKQQNIPSVTVLINDGQKVSSYAGIPASHAFGALKNVTEKEHITIETKQYDFGIFVTQLAGKKSGNDMSWIYYINGKSGEVAADKAAVSTGDRVEWRYEKPSM